MDNQVKYYKTMYSDGLIIYSKVVDGFLVAELTQDSISSTLILFKDDYEYKQYGIEQTEPCDEIEWKQNLLLMMAELREPQ